MKNKPNRIPVHTTISAYTASKLEAIQVRYQLSSGAAIDQLLILLEEKTGKLLESQFPKEKQTRKKAISANIF